MRRQRRRATELFVELFLARDFYRSAGREGNKLNLYVCHGDVVFLMATVIALVYT